MTAPVTLDLSPQPGAAPAGRRVLRHARTEARLMLRNGEQVLLALVIPIGLLVAGRFLAGRWIPLGVLAPSVWALAVWSTCFTSLAIATGFERRYGVLERLAATPLGRGGLLLGKATAIAALTAGQLVVLLGVALALGWRPEGSPSRWLVAGLTAAVGAVAFAACALLLAGRLRAEVTLALANLIYLLGLSLGGIMVPRTLFPAGLAELVGWLPTAAVADALRAVGGGPFSWRPLPVVTAWAVLAVVAARRLFRWAG